MGLCLKRVGAEQFCKVWRYLESHHIAVLAQQELQQGGRGLLEQLAQVSAGAVALQDRLCQLELRQGMAVL